MLLHCFIGSMGVASDSGGTSTGTFWYVLAYQRNSAKSSSAPRPLFPLKIAKSLSHTGTLAVVKTLSACHHEPLNPNTGGAFCFLFFFFSC